MEVKVELCINRDEWQFLDSELTWSWNKQTQINLGYESSLKGCIENVTLYRWCLIWGVNEYQKVEDRWFRSMNVTWWGKRSRTCRPRGLSRWRGPRRSRRPSGNEVCLPASCPLIRAPSSCERKMICFVVKRLKCWDTVITSKTPVVGILFANVISHRQKFEPPVIRLFF